MQKVRQFWVKFWTYGISEECKIDINRKGQVLLSVGYLWVCSIDQSRAGSFTYLPTYHLWLSVASPFLPLNGLCPFSLWHPVVHLQRVLNTVNTVELLRPARGKHSWAARCCLSECTCLNCAWCWPCKGNLQGWNSICEFCCDTDGFGCREICQS